MSGRTNQPGGEHLQHVTNDVLAAQLAQEARVEYGERILPEEGERIPDPTHVLIRQRAKDFLREFGWSVERLAKSCVYKQNTIQQYLGDNYAGDKDAVARDIETTISQIRRGDKPSDPKDYIRWSVAENILGVLEFAQRTRSMVLISGDGGRGKTMVCQAAVGGAIKGSFLITAKRSHRTEKDVARLIAQSLRARSEKNSPYTTAPALIEAICNRLRGSIGLLIFDEAHLLSARGIELIRDIHKDTGVGIALVGNKDIKELIADYDDEHGQMHSLFSRTYNILDAQNDPSGGGKLIHSVKDIHDFAKRQKVRLSDAAARWLCGLVCAESMGGWRSARWALIAAEKVREIVNTKRGIASTEITLDHIKHGWKQVRDLATSNAYSNRIDRAVERVIEEEPSRMAAAG